MIIILSPFYPHPELPIVINALWQCCNIYCSPPGDQEMLKQLFLVLGGITCFLCLPRLCAEFPAITLVARHSP